MVGPTSMYRSLSDATTPSDNCVTPKRGPDKLTTDGAGGGVIIDWAAAGSAETKSITTNVAVRMGTSMHEWCTGVPGNVLIAALKCAETGYIARNYMARAPSRASAVSQAAGAAPTFSSGSTGSSQAALDGAAARSA